MACDGALLHERKLAKPFESQRKVQGNGSTDELSPKAFEREGSRTSLAFAANELGFVAYMSDYELQHHLRGEMR